MLSSFITLAILAIPGVIITRKYFQSDMFTTIMLSLVFAVAVPALFLLIFTVLGLAVFAVQFLLFSIVLSGSALLWLIRKWKI